MTDRHEGEAKESESWQTNRKTATATNVHSVARRGNQKKNTLKKKAGATNAKSAIESKHPSTSIEPTFPFEDVCSAAYYCCWPKAK